MLEDRFLIGCDLERHLVSQKIPLIEKVWFRHSLNLWTSYGLLQQSSADTNMARIGLGIEHQSPLNSDVSHLYGINYTF